MKPKTFRTTQTIDLLAAIFTPEQLTLDTFTCPTSANLVSLDLAPPVTYLVRVLNPFEDYDPQHDLALRLFTETFSTEQLNRFVDWAAHRYTALRTQQDLRVPYPVSASPYLAPSLVERVATRLYLVEQNCIDIEEEQWIRAHLCRRFDQSTPLYPSPLPESPQLQLHLLRPAHE